MMAATHAVQIHGAYGTHEEYHVARHFRDAKVMQIVEGQNQLHSGMVAEYPLGYRGWADARGRSGPRLLAPDRADHRERHHEEPAEEDDGGEPELEDAVPGRQTTQRGKIVCSGVLRIAAAIASICTKTGGKTMVNGIHVRSFSACVICGSRSGRKDATIMTSPGIRTTRTLTAPQASCV